MLHYAKPIDKNARMHKLSITCQKGHDYQKVKSRILKSYFPFIQIDLLEHSL
jgi:hypothetical protein